uniref:Uncharacterized protein n=1 Tax=Romanomermis culicivorax TaxID=13658 RepID=A0A915JPD2_ROMCU
MGFSIKYPVDKFVDGKLMANTRFNSNLALETSKRSAETTFDRKDMAIKSGCFVKPISCALVQFNHVNRRNQGQISICNKLFNFCFHLINSYTDATDNYHRPKYRPKPRTSVNIKQATKKELRKLEYYFKKFMTSLDLFLP